MILMMEMIVIILILMMGIMMVMMEMVVMVEMVMEMMVVMLTEIEETVETMAMMTMMHCWLKGGPRRSTMIYKEMPTTTPSFSHSYAATTPGELYSTGRSIGPTPTTLASGRQRCTSKRGLGCATSTAPSLHGSHVWPSLGTQLDRRWWSTATTTSTTSPGRTTAIFPAVRADSLHATSLHHLERRT